MDNQMALPKVLSPQEPERVRLPDERKSLTHKFVIRDGDKRVHVEDGKLVETTVDLNIYVTVGFFDDGKLGEIFIKIGKEGSRLSGIYDSFAIAVSLALQCGIPVDAYIDKFEHTRFEPAGITDQTDMPIAKSILDYIFKWLKRFSEKTRTSVIPEDAGDGNSGCSQGTESGEAERAGSSSVRVCPKEGNEDKGANAAG